MAVVVERMDVPNLSRATFAVRRRIDFVVADIADIEGRAVGGLDDPTSTLTPRRAFVYHARSTSMEH